MQKLYLDKLVGCFNICDNILSAVQLCHIFTVQMLANKQSEHKFDRFKKGKIILLFS